MTRGRTGALLGADGAKIDYVAALLGVRATTARDWPRLPADVRALYRLCRGAQPLCRQASGRGAAVGAVPGNRRGCRRGIRVALALLLRVRFGARRTARSPTAQTRGV